MNSGRSLFVYTETGDVKKVSTGLSLCLNAGYWPSLGAMAQIRGTIELLAKIMRENGTSKVKAETFRLAKFDNDEAVEPLWKLLFEVLYYTEYLKIDEVCVKAAAELSTQEFVVYVKRELQRRGFLSKDFLNLPTDMNSGSRELLLAFGWLLCKECVIEQFMKNCTSPLDEDTAQLDQGDSIISSQFLSMEMSQQPEERVKQLLWLNNKLRLSLRGLHALQRERTKLRHKIHEATLGVSASPDRSHLSMLEVYMLRHPELLKKNLQLLDKDNERLQNLLKWQDHQDIFWKWMESVLDAKMQFLEVQGGHSTEGSTSGKSDDMAAEEVACLERAHNQLTDAIMKYESIVDNLERLWETKSSEVSEEELDNVLASIDMEISIQKANLTLSQFEQTVSTKMAEPTMVLQKPNTQRAPTGGSFVASPAAETLKDICGEIEALQGTVDALENELDKRHELFTEEMNKVSNSFQDAVVIPPMPKNI